MSERARLTERQWEITKLAVSGLSNREIAESLGVRLQTVKNQLAATYERLGFKPATGRRRATTRRALREWLSGVAGGNSFSGNGL